MGYSILVADDDPVLLQTLSEQLTSETHSVTAASNGEQTISFLKKQQFDIAIIDIKMPKPDGFDVLKFIKENYPPLKVIMLTAYADLTNAMKCEKLGADEVIEKPYDVGEVFDAIHYLMKK